MNKKSWKQAILVILIVILSILIIQINKVESETVPTTSQISLPYREGDWFEYKLEYKVSNASCWARMKVEITEINPNHNVVVVESKITKSGGDEECTQRLGLTPDHSTTSSINLNNEPQSLQILIDPKYTGTYNCSQEGVRCIVKYNKGVLTELALEFKLSGHDMGLHASLVGSSILFYSSTLIWITIGIFGGVILAIILLIIVFRRKERKIESLITQQSVPYLSMTSSLRSNS
ncbi:MAG: hypothetical protein QXE81_05285 [Desulfurococcaceae archaeon]